MKRGKYLTWMSALAVLCALPVFVLAMPHEASAQTGPDVRSIPPVIMLLVDSSGSMEYLSKCVCSTTACSECIPSCSSAMTPPRNRWALVLESLTGRWSDADYSCTLEDRDDYFLPHVALPVDKPRVTNGIIRDYRDQVRFGLMTFDGVQTLRTSSELVPTASFNDAQSRGPLGDYSYGENKELFFPGCTTNFMINSGAKSESAEGGKLISVGPGSADIRLVNDQIITALEQVKPHGPTPIAAMLDDLRYYFANDPDIGPPATLGAGSGDPYFACRSRHVLLLTDGYPNADFRGAPFYCEDASDPNNLCPYEPAEDIARDLCQPVSLGGVGEVRCTGVVDKVHVVGFDIDDPQAIARLEDIALAGGSTRAFYADSDPDTVTCPGGAASCPDEPRTLDEALRRIIDAELGNATTRTVPALASGVSGGAAQYQFNTGFSIGRGASEPWEGRLERRRFECDGLDVKEQPVLPEDQFGEVLNGRAAPRKLLTVTPADRNLNRSALAGKGAAHIDAALADFQGPFAPVSTGLDLRDFDNSVEPEFLGLTAQEATRRDTIVNWVSAGPASGREQARLGDIVNSSPSVVVPPLDDLADESFNFFRGRPEVRNRPPVVYVASNDGILHAFAVDNWNPSDFGDFVSPKATALTGGEELWGFIPPFLLESLQFTMDGRRVMFDGAPLTHDVFFTKLPGAPPTEDDYHTVLVIGLRGGGAGYIALDVTDPFDPKFLWQFAHPKLGDAFGQPSFAQVSVELGGTLHQRGVVIIPGGRGTLSGDGACTFSGDQLPPDPERGTTPRATRRCWNPQGRQLFVVDAATGKTLRHFDERGIAAPLSGGVSVFTGEVGTIATRAFMNDEDGVMWRLDMASSNPNDWNLKAFYDLFGGEGHAAGSPAYNPPVISVDDEGNVVILQATGDIDRLDETTTANRIVSLTEVAQVNTIGTIANVATRVNWHRNLAMGEQVTGPLALFSGRVYYASFTSTATPTNACGEGFSMICGHHYRETVEEGSTVPAPGLPDVADATRIETQCYDPIPNQIIMGVQIAQRPTCLDEQDLNSVYSRTGVRGANGGNYQLVAQISGGSAAPASGGTIDEIAIDLPQPDSPSRVLSWVGVARE